MTEKEYRAHPAISRSELWRIHESPEKFKWFKDHPPEPTDSLLFGQVVHKLLLEPDTFSDQFTVCPNFDRRTKDGKEQFAQFMSEAVNGREIVSSETYNLAIAMVGTCRLDDEVMALLNGAKEQPFFWTDEPTGEECKCRVDCLTDIDGEVVIIDYKTTANASTHKFVRDMYSYGYHFQAGMYCTGVKEALSLPKLPRFIFIAQEKKPPYSINRIELPEDVIQLGVDLFREYIGIYHDCKMTDWWYGYNGPTSLTNEAYLLEWVKDGEDGDLA